MKAEAGFADDALLQAELLSAYAYEQHLHALVDVLHAGICGLIEALTPLPDVPGLTPVAVEHLRLALREARQALHMAETHLDNEVHHAR